VLTNRELDAYLRIGIVNKLIIKLKRKYIKKAILKTYNNRFSIYSFKRKLGSDLGKVGDSTIAMLNSLLETISVLTNIKRL
jgi:hypothetical protein